MLTGSEFDGNDFLKQLADRLRGRLKEMEAEVAHLKLTLSPETGVDLAVANLVRGDGTVEMSHQLAEGLEHGQLILNLRAEGDPKELRQTVLEELEGQRSRLGLSVTLEHAEAFRPGHPVPTHRLAEV
jgi:hypothetical protein